MRRALLCAKIALCVAGIALCAVLAAAVLELRHQVAATQSAIVPTIAKLNLELDEAHRVTLEAGLTAMEARKASAEERAALAGWNVKISETMVNANRVLVSLKTTSDQAALSEQQLSASASSTLKTADQAIANLEPVESGAAAEFAQLQSTTAGLQALIDSPDIVGTIHNVDVTTTNLAATSTDFQNKFHAVLYPPPCRGNWCWLIHSMTIIKEGGALMEPTYWGIQVAKQF